MIATRGKVCLVVLVVIGLLVTPAGSALGNGTMTTDEAETSPSMGDEVTTFMQANTAKTTYSIDEGMFDAAYRGADADRRAVLVAERTDQFESKLQALETEYNELTEQSDEMNPAAYEARMTRVAVQLSALNQSLTDTERRAKEVGANTTKLHELRANASELAGPEVAQRAQRIAGVEPPRGPPEHAGPAHNGSAPGPNDDRPATANDNGPEKTNSSNESDPPDDHSGTKEKSDEEEPSDDKEDSDNGTE